MERFWIQLLAVLTLLTQTCSASDTTELTRAVGGSVTFHSNNTDTKPALWSFGDEPILTVLFEDPPRPKFHKEEYKTRVTVSESGRALSISQLSTEDAGTYSVKIDGKTSTFTIWVYRELPEPTVTCKSLNCSDGNCLISLRCSVPGAGFGDVSYTWRAQDWQWEWESVVLLVNKSSWDNLEPLTCTAWNAVSSRNVTVTTPRGLCPENSTHSPDPGAPSGSGVEIVVIAAVIVVVMILLFFLLFFCKSKGWRKFHLFQSKRKDKVTTAESTTVSDGVEPSQQHIPNGIKGEPAGGESSSTIYSPVKRPEQVESATVTGLELV